MAELAPGGDLAAYLATPLPPATARILYCSMCGAITYIRFPADGGIGDPEAHNRYHANRGEMPDGV